MCDREAVNDICDREAVNKGKNEKR